jgi:hypothetical protein
MNKIPPCPICGEHFEDIFEATDHLLEEGEPEFDPKLILPNGYTLMVGSLLRCLHGYADKPEEIRKIVQSTYATLYAAETNPGEMKAIIEDMIIRDTMFNIDSELKQLLEEENPIDEESGE